MYCLQKTASKCRQYSTFCYPWPAGWRAGSGFGGFQDRVFLIFLIFLFFLIFLIFPNIFESKKLAFPLFLKLFYKKTSPKTHPLEGEKPFKTNGKTMFFASLEIDCWRSFLQKSLKNQWNFNIFRVENIWKKSTDPEIP